ncbi:mismatch-specific DNA-glycosylase [Paenibacillus shunpengii]|uniref:Mismatch-specific DNA-glycosylase n=1 Tax=Paenibacillus shunpengii TaxID=2054424 RepID=A0ABW5SHL3_9BACL|nr:mismatch-specific DNA-glycosylase [Paenibacillus sp. FSL H7-0326]OMC72044.1 mismatch-specific DNA-glycosylase [Paenibacillus sp. FSL H7-0326]
MEAILDHLEPGLQIVFIGFNPSIRSGETGHHYANPRNNFYRILYQAGLTPRLYQAEEDQDLLKLGYGFTNIVARPTKGIEDITKEEYAEGRILLKNKLEKYRPEVACFVGKGVYAQYSKKSKAHWGFQPEPYLSGMHEFVAPSSSGLVRMPMTEIIEIYKQLGDYIHRERS